MCISMSGCTISIISTYFEKKILPAAGLFEVCFVRDNSNSVASLNFTFLDILVHCADSILRAK